MVCYSTFCSSNSEGMSGSAYWRKQNEKRVIRAKKREDALIQNSEMLWNQNDVKRLVAFCHLFSWLFLAGPRHHKRRGEGIKHLKSHEECHKKWKWLYYNFLWSFSSSSFFMCCACIFPPRIGIKSTRRNWSICYNGLETDNTDQTQFWSSINYCIKASFWFLFNQDPK